MRNLFHFSGTSPAYAMIWLHGLGASGGDMRAMVKTIEFEGVFIRHVFLDAPMRPVTINQSMVMPAWYDILGTQFVDREDQAGIEASRAMIEAEIEALYQEGFESHQILLLGFSQGAAMALYTGLHSAERLAGVVALSGYLPLAQNLKPVLPRHTPIFVGYGRYDPIVMPAWTQLSIEGLESWGYEALTVVDYPIEHRVCPEELQALTAWVKQLPAVGKGK